MQVENKQLHQFLSVINRELQLVDSNERIIISKEVLDIINMIKNNELNLSIASETSHILHKNLINQTKKFDSFIDKYCIHSNEMIYLEYNEVSNKNFFSNHQKYRNLLLKLQIAFRNLFSSLTEKEDKETKKKRVLFIHACPRDQEFIRAPKEAGDLQELIDKYPNKFELKTRWSANNINFFKYIENLKPDILHFSGHSDPRGLIVSDVFDKSHLIDNKEFNKEFAKLGLRIDLVLFNSCYSTSFVDNLDCSIACYISNKDFLDDDEALDFSRNFYEEFTSSEDLNLAYIKGETASGNNNYNKR